MFRKECSRSLFRYSTNDAFPKVSKQMPFKTLLAAAVLIVAFLTLASPERAEEDNSVWRRWTPTELEPQRNSFSELDAIRCLRLALSSLNLWCVKVSERQPLDSWSARDYLLFAHSE
jgi:hypothetical protein